MDILSDLSPAALGRAVEENASALWPSWAAWEGIVYEESARWRRVSSSLRHPAFNHLYGLVLDGEEPGRVLASALAPFRKAGLPCFCWLDPVTAQRRGRLLDGAGLEHLFGAPGMALRLGDAPPRSGGPEGLVIGEVATERELLAWCRTVSEASGFPAAAAAAWEQLHGRIPFGSGTQRRHFLGTLDGELAGASSLFLAAGVAGLYSVTVPQRYRRRGFGTALSLAALEAARREGFRAAVLVATADGAGIYRRLGFREYRRWECRLLRGA